MTDLWGLGGSKFFSTVLMNTDDAVVVDTKLLGLPTLYQFESLKPGTAMANELILHVPQSTLIHS